MKDYRPDIDGLRALAVLPVVLFHAGIPGFGGGFVGVDVFFVISGFLITGIVVRDVDAGRFSILRFYERRFRRLMPALFAVVPVTLFAAWPLLSAGQLRLQGEQVLATSVFASNLYFWRSADYFAPAADDNLFLHTWSLAVEEQFYVFFPLLLLLIGATPRLRLALVWLITVVSLLGSEYGAQHHPDLAFFVLPTRAWELMVGSLLALGAVPAPRTPVVRSVLAGLGLLAMAWANTMFWKGTVFPGFSAAVPVLGAAMVIHAGTGGAHAASPLLASAPLVWLGRISYSVYLWHWPILLLCSRYLDAGLPESNLAMGLGLLLTFPVGYASWRWIEEPFRHSAASQRAVLGAAALATLAMAVAGLGIRLGADRLSTWTPEAEAVLENTQRTPPCYGHDPQKPGCAIGAGAPAVALWGDSHAQTLVSAFQVLAEAQGWAAVSHTKAGCPPLLGVSRKGHEDGCVAFSAQALERLVARTEVRTVVLVGRWSLATESTKPDDPGDVFVITDGTGPDAPIEVFERGLLASVRALRAAGKRVVVLGDVPEIPWIVPATVGLHRRLGREVPVHSQADAVARQERVHALLTRLAAGDGGFEYVPLVPALCASGVCPTVVDERPVYVDADHLSLSGAREVVAPVLRDLLALP